MSLFSFVKEAGEKLLDLLTSGNANASEILKKHVADVGLISPNIQVALEGDHKVVASGQAATQEEKEKVLLALGNIAGISEVEDKITLPASAATVTPRFVTVETGDTLSAISQRVYGDPNKYQKIFEANKPLLSSPDKIYPGQVLRIPE